MPDTKVVLPKTADEMVLWIGNLIEDKLQSSGLKAKPEGHTDDIPDLTPEMCEYLDKAVADQLLAIKERDIEAARQKREKKFELKAADLSKHSLSWLDNDKTDLSNVFDPRVKIYCMEKAELEIWHDAETVHALESFKDYQDRLFLAGLARAHATRRPYFDCVRETRLFKDMPARMKSDDQLRKALDTLTAGEGLEWIPTGFSSKLMELVRLQFRVAAQFETFSMPSNPYKLPVEGADFVAQLTAQATADAATKIGAATPGTANVEFSAIKLAARVLFSEEVNEDSIINMLNFSRNKLAVAFATAEETALLNGDDSTTHQDADTAAGAATLAQKSFKAHRYWALNNAGTAGLDYSNGAPTITLLRNTRKLMGKYGINPRNLFWTSGILVYYKILQIAEYQKLNEFGPQAANVTGQVGSIDDSPLIVSEHVREDLNASGVEDGVTTNRGVLHLTDRRGFMTGERTGLTIQALRDAETDQMILVAKRRVDHEDVYNALSASFIQTVVGYNVLTV